MVAITDITDSTPAIASTERRASWLELFFDLCFVVAVGAVAGTLHSDPSWSGLTTSAALFIPVLGMAAQAGNASAGDPRGYVLAFVVFHLLVVLLFGRAAQLHPITGRFDRCYAVGLAIAAAVWVVSLVVPETFRSELWVVALAIDLATPIVAVASVAAQMFDFSHIPERYGLFTLIVLGEAVIAVARGTAEAQWTPGAVTAAVSGFVLAVVIWWVYFAHHQATLLLRGHLAGFIWGYGHVFVWAGIAMTGVGTELAIEAASTEHGYPTADRLILCGGFALFLAAMALLRAADAGNLWDRVALVRFMTAIAILSLGLAGGSLSPEAVTAGAAAIAIAAWFAARAAWRALPAAPNTHTSV
jgi:low temperature requirement protein LtrA